MLTSEPLEFSVEKFNRKFLLVGNSGAGKTYLCGSYTKGPIHFYMTDPGGENTLRDFIKNRSKHSPITITKISMVENTFKEVWDFIQKDHKRGFFKEMAEKNGLVVMPDSFTTFAMMAVEYVAKQNGRDLLTADKTRGMRIQDWGSVTQWMKTFISFINSLPCAVVATAHLHIDKDKEGDIVSRVPLMPGSFRNTIGLFFDEVYLLETRGNNYVINFKETGRFEAKSRLFNVKSLKNLTMDDIAKTSMTGEVPEQ